MRGREIGVDDGRRCPLIFAELGQNAMRGGDGQAERVAWPLRHAAPSPGCAKEKSNEMATASAPLARTCFHQRFQLFLCRRAKDLSLGAHPLRHAEAQPLGNQAFGHWREPVIETASCLASDGDGVFEACRSDKGDARPFAFKHRIGPDGGPVAHLDGSGRVQSAPVPPALPAEGSAGVEKSLKTRICPASR